MLIKDKNYTENVCILKIYTTSWDLKSTICFCPFKFYDPIPPNKHSSPNASSLTPLKLWKFSHTIKCIHLMHPLQKCFWSHIKAMFRKIGQFSRCFSCRQLLYCKIGPKFSGSISFAHIEFKYLHKTCGFNINTKIYYSPL